MKTTKSHESKQVVAEVEQPPTPLPEIKASPIPFVAAEMIEEAKSLENAPKDEDFIDGLFVMKQGYHVGEEFALCIHEPNTYGRTHTLRNTQHQWEGTKKEFRQAFEKK